MWIYLFLFFIKVVFLNLNNDHVTIFKCNDWLSKTEGTAKKLVRELPAEVDGKKLVNGMSELVCFLDF